MARKGTPTVQSGLLVLNAEVTVPGAERVIVVGTGTWYAWLEEASAFAFIYHGGTFTARKERFRRGGWYWRAYRRHHGRLVRAYLGKSEQLSLDCLEDAARRLARPQAPIAAGEKPWPETESMQIAGGDAGLDIATRRPIEPTRDTMLHAETRLIATKLIQPALPRDLAPRPRLTEMLKRCTEAPLAIIVSPAGYGKTTLLAEWIATCVPRVAWVSLDRSDIEPARFWLHVLAALDQARPGIAGHSRALLEASGTKALEMALVALTNALVGGDNEPIYLLLDDYHEIEDGEIHENLAAFIEHAPATLHVIIASREEPPAPFARLMARGQAATLKAQALRFSVAESEAFLSAHVDTILAPMATALAERIEGWAAGLRLSILALREGNMTPGALLNALKRGEHRALSDYLNEEVLRRLPASMRDFLFETAILDRLCGPLCDAVTGRSDSKAMLDYLEHAQLFLTPLALDAEHNWYRYHALFAAYLRARLHRDDAAREAVVHQRAAIWLEVHGEVNEAVEHALDAGDADMAVRLIETHGPVNYLRGETTTLLTWLNALPDDAKYTRPGLLLLNAEVLLVLGRTEAAASLVEVAEQALAGNRDEQPDGLRLRGKVIAARGLVEGTRGHAIAAIAAYQQALALIPESDVAQRATILGNLAAEMAYAGQLGKAAEAQRAVYAARQAAGDLAGMLDSLWPLGTLLLGIGELPAAARALQQAIDLAREAAGGQLPAASGAYHYLGKVFYEWNRLDEALPLVETCLRLNERNGDVGLDVRALLQLGRLRHAVGHVDGVRTCIGRLEQIQRTPGLRLIVTQLAGAVIARLSLILGDLAAASAWAREAGLTVAAELSSSRDFAHLTFVRVLLAEGRIEEASYFLSRLGADIATTEELNKVIELKMIQALALRAGGDRTGARVALRGALARAEPGGYIRLFVDEGEPMLALLAHLSREGVSNGHNRDHSQPAITAPYLARLLTATRANVVGTSVPTEAEQSGPLSQREIEIVRRIASGMSNAEIARDLVVELSTVKWHIHNILDKLGGRNRIGALARARALGLL